MTGLLAYFLALFVGISLGLIGSGGSILSVPILVYILHIEPVLATAYSLFVVGSTALVGGVQKSAQNLVDFKKVFLFGIPTVCGVFLMRFFVVPKIPNTIYFTTSFSASKSILILIVFAIVMVFAALRMIVPLKVNPNQDVAVSYPKIALQGLLIGCLAGFVGAGGGFLIIPALLLYAKTPMKIAIGTSLFIVAFQSLLGFLGDFESYQKMNWSLLLKFTSCAIIGLFIGNAIAKKIDGEKLKKGFGYFVLLMGIYIIIKEIFLS